MTPALRKTNKQKAEPLTVLIKIGHGYEILIEKHFCSHLKMTICTLPYVGPIILCMNFIF